MKHTAYKAVTEGVNVITYTDDASLYDVTTVPYNVMIENLMDGDFDADPVGAVGILKQIMQAEMRGLVSLDMKDAISMVRYIVAATFIKGLKEIPNEALPDEVKANEPAGAKSYMFDVEALGKQAAMTLRTFRNAIEIMVDQEVLPEAAEIMGEKMAVASLLAFYGCMIHEGENGFEMTDKGNEVMRAVVNGIFAKAAKARGEQAENLAADLHKPHTLH